MLVHRSVSAVVKTAVKIGPQFRGSILYRTRIFGVIPFGALRAVTYQPWGSSDVPVEQLRRERAHELAVSASVELSIKPTLVAMMKRLGMDMEVKRGKA